MTRRQDNGRRLSRDERQDRILAILAREGAVRIATLAKVFGVTTETARRDLDELGRRGAIIRTYGGGASRSLADEPAIGARGRTRAAERKRIAAAAAALVAGGDVVMIDCGSTTSHFAHALALRAIPLTVVTNGLPIAAALGASAQCRVILCPGVYVDHQRGVYGPATIEFLQRFNANKAFIGAGGLTPAGASDADSFGCAIKRAMIEQAERTILLLDSEKFNAIQFEQACALADLDDMVTEAPPPKPLATALRAAGVRVILARN